MTLPWGDVLAEISKLNAVPTKMLEQKNLWVFPVLRDPAVLIMSGFLHKEIIKYYKVALNTKKCHEERILLPIVGLDFGNPALTIPLNVILLYSIS